MAISFITALVWKHMHFTIMMIAWMRLGVVAKWLNYVIDMAFSTPLWHLLP
jgi:hypothetical protein